MLCQAKAGNDAVQPLNAAFERLSWAPQEDSQAQVRELPRLATGKAVARPAAPILGAPENTSISCSPAQNLPKKKELRAEAAALISY